MKLIELDPRWYALENNGPIVGLSFVCPHCMKERLAVAFHEAGKELIEDTYIKAHAPNTKHIWLKSNDTFDSLSLWPSVDASATGHWHGFVTEGETK